MAIIGVGLLVLEQLNSGRARKSLFLETAVVVLELEKNSASSFEKELRFNSGFSKTEDFCFLPNHHNVHRHLGRYYGFERVRYKEETLLCSTTTTSIVNSESVLLVHRLACRRYCSPL